MFLVTGATGFVGSAVVALLHERGHAVRAVVRDPARADVLPDGVERVAADLADGEALARAMDGCEGVFHLAAAVGAPGPEAHELNVGGTRRVVEAARRAGVRRLVHTSTSAAICVPDPSGPGCVVAEDAAGGTALTDTYSTTKAEAEAVVLDAAAGGAAGGLDAVVATVVSVYGPSPRGPWSYNGLLAAAARGEVGAIVDTRIGWVLAEDVAAGQLLAFEHGETGRRYVLCGEVASFPTVLDTYCALTGSPHRVTALPEGSELDGDAPPFADRSVVYGHLGGYRVRDDGARALGLRARGIEEGLELTARWLRAM
ncbi:NAD-dependent epimerase/dehydratase family protein [Actinomycetospora cinnamomea]|uniref:Dihydroflavonol-4-reductase n=1 Tax=Actinomycetospora cinnamomea TaxID=663609 RepID=A0A2U1FFM8_9PSEU|nr:NAD-dependent epimerase/dehydratase family protein [Actinomycetospora cinnamomea]PVZ10936.1 dihydroflavonol-4-reductase [Actinomycetospora cinnamomea]